MIPCMSMQMNAVSSETLRGAMVHPENYRNLIVRISGYNANPLPYFSISSSRFLF